MENYGFMNLLSHSDLSNEKQNKLEKIIESELDFTIPINPDETPSIEYSKSSQSSHNVLEIDAIINAARKRRLMTLKARIEAILFLSDKPRSAESIAEEAEADVDQVRQSLSQLVQEYEDRESGIVIDCSEGYCMQIRDEFEDLTENILPIELRTAVLRTLSTIALKEPILQSDLVQIRGGGVYDHVKELVEMGLVKKTKEGHSHILHTTPYFSENFKLSQNGIELQTVLKNASPTKVKFVKPNSLLPSDEEEEVKAEDSFYSEETNVTKEKDELEQDKVRIAEIQETIQAKQEQIEAASDDDNSEETPVIL